MVALYVGGQKVEWDDAEKVLAGAERVELRNAAGKVLGLVVAQPPASEDYPDWVKAITPEEIARRRAGEFVTFDELKKRMGWQ